MEVSLKEQIVKLRKEGWLYKDIRKELKCTMSLISYHCKNAGLETANELRKPTKEEIESYQKLYNTGLSVKQIAKSSKWSHVTLLKYLQLRDPISKEEIKKRNGQKQMSRRKKFKELLVAYKGGKCERCGYDKCIRALEFHHINHKTKEFTLSQGTYSFERLKKEVDKCLLVCANCHREIEEKEYNKNVS